MINREPIYAALFALVSAAAPFVTVSRRMKPFAEVTQALQPALFMQQISEEVMRTRPVPAKHILRVDLAIYSYTADTNVTPAIAMNGLVNAVEAALEPVPLGPQTLGGLVSHCYIAGLIQTDEGVLGSQSISVIPIEIVTA